MKLVDFRLPAGAGSPGKVVARFFSDNLNYLRGDSTLSHSEDTLESCLAQLYAAAGITDFDERHHAVEVHFTEDLELHGDLLAAILPKSLVGSSLAIALTRMGATTVPYFDQRLSDPSEDARVIAAKAFEYLEENDAL